jgi:hypothetical protein
VVVLDYPRLFNGQDCNAFTWFSSSEETRLNQTALPGVACRDRLNNPGTKRSNDHVFADMICSSLSKLSVQPSW